jgi:hypothetical protein
MTSRCTVGSHERAAVCAPGPVWMLLGQQKFQSLGAYKIPPSTLISAYMRGLETYREYKERVISYSDAT